MDVRILILIALLQNANAFGLDDDDDDGPFQKCVTRVTNKLFENDYYVYVIIDTFDGEILQCIEPPKIIWNVNVTEKMESQLIGKSLIIQVDDWPNLEKALTYLNRSKIWDRVETPRGTFLVVINVEKVKATFEMLWRYSIHNAMVLVKHELKLYQSNPQTVKNGCGKSANLVHVQGCEEIQIMFKKGYRKYSGCSTGLRSGPFQDVGRLSKRQSLSSATVDLLINKFQVTVNDDANSTHRNPFSIAPYLPKYSHRHRQYSEMVTREKVVVVLPLPNRIPPLMIYVVIFQVEVWIMVTCGFFITIFFYAILLVWHGTRITFTSLSLLNIQTLSLTLWGSCAPFPKHYSIRFLLLFYIFYSIVVQTGYVSQLIRVLTIPQYEKQVDNLAELADSPIALCVAEQVTFSGSRISQKSSLKLTYAVFDAFKNDVSSIIQTFNCSLAMRDDDALAYLSKEPRIPNKLLFDPDGGVYFAFVTRSGDYFVDTINQAIISLKENGVYAHIENHVTSEYRKTLTQFAYSDEPQVLTLHHLRGLFIIWAFCLGVSFFVFILEILIHLSYGCCTRRLINHVEPIVEPAVEPAVVELELQCVDVE